MGLIRKTLSIGTLGTVSFRSKKERLLRAERSQRRAEVSLEEEHEARTAAEVRGRKAARRVKHADAEAVYADAIERGRKAGRRARRAAKRSVRRAKDTAVSAKDAAVPAGERLVARATDAIEHLTAHDS
jgi:hypothetical protein